MKLSRRVLAGAGVAGAIAAVAAAASVAQSSLAGFDSVGEAPIRLSNDGPAPELAGIDGWLNGPPRTLGGLRGQLVLLDFWTYDCVNCLRTLPRLRRWHEALSAHGLVIIGVHSPEFAFERDRRNVARAVRRLSIPYPVALDTAHATWNAYRIRYWPSLVLIDRTGEIIFRHHGESDYDQVEHLLRNAL